MGKTKGRQGKNGKGKKGGGGKRKGTGKVRLTAKTADRHVLYEAAVQCVEADLDFFSRVFKRKRGRPFRTLKEDFCGTAALAVEWVSRHPDNRAWGVDLDRPTLDWGIAHHVSRLGKHADRVTLIEDDVMHVTKPKVEVVCGLNFSYQVFHDRDTLRRYFKAAHDSLTDDGIFFVDCFGGTEAVETLAEDRTIDPEPLPDGTRLPKFTYGWEQADFNIVDHRILCHIHFRFRDGTRIRKAFTYDWRLWTLPELQELMREAGFREVEVYLEGWDDEADEADGVFRRRTHAENMPGWVGYVIGMR